MDYPHIHKTMQMQSYIDKLSDHLFWDIDKNTLDKQKSEKTIIKRVLTYGKIEDWHILVKIYGINKITTVSKSLRDIDLKSASFVALLSNTPINDFACYTLKQSTPQHWNF